MRRDVDAKGYLGVGILGRRNGGMYPKYVEIGDFLLDF